MENIGLCQKGQNIGCWDANSSTQPIQETACCGKFMQGIKLSLGHYFGKPYKSFTSPSAETLFCTLTLFGACCSRAFPWSSCTDIPADDLFSKKPPRCHFHSTPLSLTWSGSNYSPFKTKLYNPFHPSVLDHDNVEAGGTVLTENGQELQHMSTQKPGSVQALGHQAFSLKTETKLNLNFGSTAG